METPLWTVKRLYTSGRIVPEDLRVSGVAKPVAHLLCSAILIASLCLQQP